MIFGFVTIFSLHTYLGSAMGILLYALGQSLRSGSDVSWLKSIDSKNFSKHLRISRSIDSFGASLGALAGGWFVSNELYDEAILVILGLYIIGAVLLFPIEGSADYDLDETNPFRLAIKAIKHVINRKDILATILIAALVRGYIGSVKNIVSSFASISELEPFIVGILVGLTMLARSMGYAFYDLLSKKKVYLLIVSMLILTAISQLTGDIFYTALAFIIGNVIVIQIFHFYEVSLNNLLSDRNRASILSLMNLIRRGITSLLIFFAGFILADGRFSILHFSLTLLFSLFAFLLYRVRDYASIDN